MATPHTHSNFSLDPPRTSGQRTKDGRPCPRCGGEDRFYFVPVPRDGGEPHWQCRQCDYWELDSDPSINRDTPKRKPSAKPQATAYATLADYAGERYVAAFAAAGWKMTTHAGRAALAFPTAGGQRYRFVDGGTPKYTSTKGYKRCWYGLARAVAMSQNGVPLVICNGESSVVTAQHEGVPAACITGGEGNAASALEKGLLAELQAAYPQGAVLLAFDADEAGMKATQAVARVLVGAGYDVQAVAWGAQADGYDLRDFVRLHQDGSLEALGRLVGDVPQPDAGGLPAIDISEERLGDISAAIWRHLHTSPFAERLYRFGDGLALHDGALHFLNEDAMRGIIGRVAEFHKVGKKHTQVVAPPLAFVKDAMHPLWIPDWVRVIDRVVPAPVIRRDGALLAGGYDAQSRTLVQSDITPELLPIEAARALLDDVFDEFPFASLADYANLMAYLVTFFVRDGCGSVPLFLIDAAAAGTGKGLLNKCVHRIVTGEDPPDGELPLQPEEQRKMITALLRTAPISVNFDDIKYLAGHAIQRALTSSVWQDRLLGKSETLTFPVRAVFSATGNNVVISGDMARRVVLIRLVAHAERPEQRTGFRRGEDELLAYCLSNRAQLVSACLSLAQHGWSAPQPLSLAQMGSFQAWATLLHRITHAAGYDGFLSNAPTVYQREDARQSDWRLLFEAWWNTHGESPVTAKQVLDLIEADEELGITIHGDSERAKAQSVGKHLRHRLDQITTLSGGTSVQLTQETVSTGRNRYVLRSCEVAKYANILPSRDARDFEDTHIPAREKTVGTSETSQLRNTSHEDLAPSMPSAATANGAGEWEPDAEWLELEERARAAGAKGKPHVEQLQTRCRLLPQWARAAAQRRVDAVDKEVADAYQAQLAAKYTTRL